MTARITSFAFVNPEDGHVIEYEGIFEFERDGGCDYVTIPCDGNSSDSIHPRTAQRLTTQTGDIGIAMTDDGITASGIIESADIIEEELLIRVDDAEWASPSDVDVDVEELRAEMEDE
jgi:hypothetical protein